MGGMLGGMLALHGADVSFLARGQTLEALRRGFTMIDPSGVPHHPPIKAFAASDAGAFDLVILCLKAHQLASAAPGLSPLLRAETPVLAVLNGIPWWYFHKNGGEFDGRRIAAADYDGTIEHAIGNARVIGAVIYAAAHVPKPGVVAVSNTSHMVVGEPDGRISDRATAVASLLTGAGFKTTVSPDIRSDIWTKVWGNCSFNPVSALTGAGLATIARDKGACGVVRSIMQEVEQVAARLGVEMRMGLQQRINVTESLGNHKTSMLQDIEAKRFPEIDANMGAVVEIARLVGVETPMLRAITTMTRLLAQSVVSRS